MVSKKTIGLAAAMFLPAGAYAQNTEGKEQEKDQEVQEVQETQTEHRGYGLLLGLGYDFGNYHAYKNNQNIDLEIGFLNRIDENNTAVGIVHGRKLNNVPVHEPYIERSVTPMQGFDKIFEKETRTFIQDGSLEAVLSFQATKNTQAMISFGAYQQAITTRIAESAYTQRVLPNGTTQTTPRVPGSTHEFKDLVGGTIAGVGAKHFVGDFGFYVMGKRTFNMPDNKTSVRAGVVYYPRFLRVKKP